MANIIEIYVLPESFDGDGASRRRERLPTADMKKPTADMKKPTADMKKPAPH
jgi:hypothetical protein